MVLRLAPLVHKYNDEVVIVGVGEREPTVKETSVIRIKAEVDQNSDFGVLSVSAVDQKATLKADPTVKPTNLGGPTAANHYAFVLIVPRGAV